MEKRYNSKRGEVDNFIQGSRESSVDNSKINRALAKFWLVFLPYFHLFLFQFFSWKV